MVLQALMYIENKLDLNPTLTKISMLVTSRMMSHGKQIKTSNSET